MVKRISALPPFFVWQFAGGLGLNLRVGSVEVNWTEEQKMPPMLVAKKTELEAACKQFGVARLELFGSAVTNGFDSASSDLDFLVSFSLRARDKAFDNYFGLRERLEQMFGRPVDLVTIESIKNPYFLEDIERHRQPIYGA